MGFLVRLVATLSVKICGGGRSVPLRSRTTQLRNSLMALPLTITGERGHRFCFLFFVLSFLFFFFFFSLSQNVFFFSVSQRGSSFFFWFNSCRLQLFFDESGIPKYLINGVQKKDHTLWCHVFPRARFELMCRSLHLNDNTQMPKSGSPLCRVLL